MDWMDTHENGGLDVRSRGDLDRAWESIAPKRDGPDAQTTAVAAPNSAFPFARTDRVAIRKPVAEIKRGITVECSNSTIAVANTNEDSPRSAKKRHHVRTVAVQRDA